MYEKIHGEAWCWHDCLERANTVVNLFSYKIESVFLNLKASVYCDLIKYFYDNFIPTTWAFLYTLIFNRMC